ncbi:hypothetical protein JAAARDRAFT_209110 [Jaapia argillacea MUCL 33604]|uniref:Uncharacterized protein n=1 Tax=Jaapia argillacea MUCL 33604 TaxID=933084 RepID=A0A067PJC5_9AGAM|nr:hypothetical protein JAAARDRAFT_209110 [Jaapia argillacea MUCL 33604]
MSPKPRAPRKTSSASKHLPTPAKDYTTLSSIPPNMKDPSTSMPPPPDPLPPQKILEPEINAMGECLRRAMVKTGQIYGFYADTRRLHIQNHAPQPPRSLTASLGREVEKYDQLCDAMESHLLHAIAVLQRDLSREQKRLQDAELAAAKARLSAQVPPHDARSGAVVRQDTFLLPGSPTSLVGETSNQTVRNSPPSGALAPAYGSARRPSAISLSSLHRPPFPHKLDLSAATLRIGTDEASMLPPSGLASPVTLAPKSARPTTSDFAPDFMAALASSDMGDTSVEMDLSLSDPDPSAGSLNLPQNTHVDSGVGSSADKPIELDLDMDMTDIFGDATESGANDTSTVGDLFHPGGSATSDLRGANGEGLDMEILDALGAGHEDIFASLGASQSDVQPSAQENLRSDGSDASGGPDNQPSTIAPSPASILASFASAPNPATDSANPPTSSETPFDMGSLDLSNLSNLSPSFFGNEHGADMNLTDMEALFSMDSGDGGATSNPMAGN